MGILLSVVMACSIAASPILDKGQPVPTSTWLEQAQRLVEAHKLEQANELLTEVLQSDPGNETALLNLGQVQLAQGLNDDALKTFETILGTHPNLEAAREGEVKAATAAALADRNAGINDSALICLIRARKFVPDSPELLLDFGIQAESMRIYRDADAALTRAHEIFPRDSKILYALARVQLDEQKMPEAEANLRTYLSLQPDDATAHYGLGHLLHMLLKYNEAKSELAQSITLHPRQSSSYYELGEIALEQGDNAGARSNYEEVLSLAPHHGGALTGMGILEFRAKNYLKAEEYLQAAVLYASDYATAHHYYALVLSRLGRQAESAQESDLARSLNEQQTKTAKGNFLTVIQ